MSQKVKSLTIDNITSYANQDKIKSVYAINDIGDGFRLFLKLDDDDDTYVLRAMAKKDEPRIFKTAGTLFSLIKTMGINKFKVINHNESPKAQTS